MTKQQEKEFLILAGFMLLCRWQLMGNDVEVFSGKHYFSVGGRDHIEISLLGYTDSAVEMELLLKETTSSCHENISQTKQSCPP
jgi:hypothetical protein